MNKYQDQVELIVRLIIKNNDAVLLCLNKGANHYFLPGGHVEFGDTLERTIYKEMEEELGWTEEDITSFKFRGYLETSYSNGDELHAELDMIFDVEVAENVAIESQESHIGFEWVKMANISNIKILPETIVPFLL